MNAGSAVKKLGDIVSVQSGFAFKSNEYAKSGHFLIRISNVQNGFLTLSKPQYVTLDDRTKRFELSEGDLLTSLTGNVGRVAKVEAHHLPAALNQRVARLVPKSCMNVDPQYLLHFLQSATFFEFLEKRAHGAAQANVSPSVIGDVPLLLPPLEEQQRIVAVLDEAFEGLTRARAHAEANLQNARELFANFLGAVFSKSERSWRTAKLDQLVEADCTLSYGIVQPGDEIANGLPIVRPTDLGERIITLNGLKRIDPDNARGYARTLLKGCEILLCVRGSTGVLSIASEELAGANVTRGIVPVRFDPSQMNQQLGYYQFLSKPIQDQIKAGTYGAALMQINIRDLRILTFVAPPLDQQAVLVAQLDSVAGDFDQLVENYSDKVSEIDALRQSLLQKAFAGELT